LNWSSSFNCDGISAAAAGGNDGDDGHNGNHYGAKATKQQPLGHTAAGCSRPRRFQYLTEFDIPGLGYDELL